METLERSRVCRLCGKHAGTAIDIFDKRGNHVKKINSVLPILVHEMDLLPKHICQLCNYKLQEFHKFYEDCLRTDASLKGQLSWMRGSMDRGDVGVPMVQISNFMIKTEPPDYDDGDTAEAVFRGESLASCAEDTCALYPKKIFASSVAKCSRCGSRRAKSPSDERRARTGAKSRAARHNGVEKSGDGNEQFASRDSIRRNLFATEIFGDENPRIRTEIPMCNVRGATTSDDVARLGASAKLERLGYRQDGGRVATKLEMATRTLRPRRTRAAHLPRAASAPEAATKSRGRSGSRNNDAPGSDAMRSIAIKLEASKEFERSLRPRVGPINYSDTRRKNPLARASDGKRKRSLEDHAPAAKVRRTDDKRNVARVNFAAVKVEPVTFLETASLPKTSRENAKAIAPRSAGRRAEITFADFLKTSVVEKISARKNFDGRKSLDADPSRASQSSRRRSTVRGALKASPFLRSQRVHLRSGRLREFESVAERPKRIQREEHGILLKAIKREDARSKRTIFKHRDCEICCSRFASAELYMLHDCYANRRH